MYAADERGLRFCQLVTGSLRKVLRVADQSAFLWKLYPLEDRLVLPLSTLHSLAVSCPSACAKHCSSAGDIKVLEKYRERQHGWRSLPSHEDHGRECSVFGGRFLSEL